MTKISSSGILLAWGIVLAMSGSAVAADKVKVGIVGSFSDAPLYLALEKGYFKEAGIEPEFEELGALTRQVAPLSAGQLDVASGNISAGLYNAVDRSIPMKVVADKGRNAPGYGYNAIMVRKDLYDSGAVKSAADMKGRSLATIGAGSADMSIINEFMKTGKLGYDDVKQSVLTLPNHLIALENKGIDATLTPEPFASIIEAKGVGVKLATVDSFYPDQQQLVLIYGAKFIQDRKDVAQRFMKAYIRGVRAYMDGLKDGKIAGPNADDVIATIIKYTRTKDAGLLKRIAPVVVDGDGKVNLAGMKKDWEFLKSKDLVKQTTTPEELLDMSFADAAVKELGPYKKP